MNQNTKKQQHGVTLIEACITMTLAAIVASSAAPSMKSLLDARRLDGVASQLATDLQFTRVTAVARNEGVRFSVKAVAGGSCYVIHTGSADQCRCTADAAPAQCSGAARQIKTVWLPSADRIAVQANVASILFNPVHGTSTPTGTLRVIGSGDREVRHIVNIMGRVRSCSPQGASGVGGYRAC